MFIRDIGCKRVKIAGTFEQAEYVCSRIPREWRKSLKLRVVKSDSYIYNTLGSECYFRAACTVRITR